MLKGDQNELEKKESINKFLINQKDKLKKRFMKMLPKDDKKSTSNLSTDTEIPNQSQKIGELLKETRLIEPYEKFALTNQQKDNKDQWRSLGMTDKKPPKKPAAKREKPAYMKIFEDNGAPLVESEDEAEFQRAYDVNRDLCSVDDVDLDEITANAALDTRTKSESGKKLTPPKSETRPSKWSKMSPLAKIAQLREAREEKKRQQIEEKKIVDELFTREFDFEEQKICLANMLERLVREKLPAFTLDDSLLMKRSEQVANEVCSEVAKTLEHFKIIVSITLCQNITREPFVTAIQCYWDDVFDFYANYVLVCHDYYCLATAYAIFCPQSSTKIDLHW